jgi:hypothetical protein
VESMTATAPATEAPVETPTREQTKPLKLSEAIRLGAMATQQTFGAWGNTEHTCAIGAAQVALGVTPGDGDRLNQLLRSGPVVELPCLHEEARPVGDGIIHLNDTDHWPRERIAGWLETLGL